MLVERLVVERIKKQMSLDIWGVLVDYNGHYPVTFGTSSECSTS